ncbi:MAG: hypothetical protein JNM07_10485 [Phycisphaerae bacterium]|nr:hypothetical protein [Phycisphaerae bacterium]
MEYYKIRIALALLGLVVVFAYPAYRKFNASKEVAWDMKTIISEVENYREYKEYYDYLVEEAHKQAFDHSFSAGIGRRASGEKFNADQYLEEAIVWMIARAKQDGSTHIAAALEKHFFEEEEPQGTADKKKNK